MTLQTAAELLGISSDAVRKRAKRGTIPYETGVDGKLYVWVDEGVPSPGETDGYPREAGAVPGAVPVRDDLLEELRDQVAFLRRELEAERNAHAETRRITYTLAQRVPELEPPRGAPHGPETVAEGDAGTSAPPDPDPGVQRRERSWWRRFFGFE